MWRSDDLLPEVRNGTRLLKTSKIPKEKMVTAFGGNAVTALFPIDQRR